MIQQPAEVFSLSQIIFQIIANWWWILPPIILFPFAARAWLWWRRELWEKKQKYVFLELIFPQGTEKPISSMEQIFATLWPVHSSIEGMKNFKKKWWIGKKLQYISIEIVSTGARPRFFIRCNQEHRDSVVSVFYAQYPTMEITEMKESSKDNYIRYVSWNAPDSKMNLYGFDEVLKKSDAFPIKTYTQFFEMKPENTKEEKRIDPINTLLEGLNQLKDGEQIWIQMRMAPVGNDDDNYLSRGRKIINKFTRRKEKKNDLLSSALGGGPNKSSNEMIPSEMKMTPREREIVKAVEDKIGKYVYQTNIRVIYFADNRVFNASRKSLAENYFSSFSIPDMNVFGKFGKTKTKILHFFTKRRLYIRKRKILRRYILRETPLYPKKGGMYILSIEELATIFHPPVEARLSGTQLPHITAKKGEAPENLPM